MPSGGYRPNSGRKTNWVSIELKLPKEDKEAVKLKHGKSFNQMFRWWVKTLLK